MKVFISWSGARSKAVATALRQWLPDVIQAVQPWMSEADIRAGGRWIREIDQELSDTKFGVICLTKHNHSAPWILFEAGALAKTIEGTFVCPYLIDLAPSEVPQGPLAQFQAKVMSEKGTWDLVCTMNKALKEDALSEDQLKRIFGRSWPELERNLRNLPEEETTGEVRRSVEDMVREVLELVRELSQCALPVATYYYPMTQPVIAPKSALESLQPVLDYSKYLPPVKPKPLPGDPIQAARLEAFLNQMNQLAKASPSVKSPTKSTKKA